MRRLGVCDIVAALGFLALLGGASAPAKAEPTLAEELIEILHERGHLSEGEYERLRARAKAERTAVQSAPEPPRDEWKVHWKDGTRIESTDGRFKIKIGGRIMTDWAYIDADDGLVQAFGDRDLDGGNGAEFRRARLFVSGTLYENVFFKAQYDFAGGDADFKDLYIGLKEVGPFGSVRVGHFKEPFSLEELTSSKYITFMERSLANAFSPGRNTGIGVEGALWGERMTWAAGAFREADSFGGGFSNAEPYNLTARLTGLPWYVDEGEKLLHVGLSYSHRFRDTTSVRFRKRPEMHLSPVRFVDTGVLGSDDVDLVNPELALVMGPFAVQGEYTHVVLHDAGSGGDDATFGGFYVEGSVFLTGEHRQYDPEDGAFGRLRPRHDFDGRGGLGAWQVALRYSSIDLDDEGIEGGELRDVSVGLNWHLNPSVRVMLNYIHAQLDRDAGVAPVLLRDVDDGADIVEARFQIDF